MPGEAPGLSMTRILLTVNTTRLKHFMKNTSILPGTAMRNPASRHWRNRESWPQGKPLRAQEELLREGKLSGAEELAVRVVPKQKAARTWQPAREVRHSDTKGPNQSLETITGTLERPITGNTYVLEQLMDYDFLIKHFYSVHTSTTAGRDLMNAKDLLSRDMTMKGDDSKPQILIYHTHSQEAYKDSGPGQTVVGVGDYLTRLLEAKGYNVYHDTSVYDLKNGQLDRSKAYNYALDGITNILQQNPSIEVVLDIHRDGVGENLHLVTQVDGRDTAQIMFFNGLSQTPEGPIEYLQNPYREDNLAFSLQMQLGAAAYYPGFTRKIYLKGLRYNEHLRPKSSLIEVGAQTNTYEEALNAMEPLSELLDMVLQGNRKDSIIQ